MLGFSLGFEGTVAVAAASLSDSVVVAAVMPASLDFSLDSGGSIVAVGEVPRIVGGYVYFVSSYENTKSAIQTPKSIAHYHHTQRQP